MNQPTSDQNEVQFSLQPRNERDVPVLDDPPLGHLQAIVLRKLYDLESDAYGLMVLQTLSLETGVWLDHSQIYSIIRKLGPKGKGLIKVKELREQQGKRPALKIYELTASGRAALTATAEHHKAVAAYLADNNK